MKLSFLKVLALIAAVVLLFAGVISIFNWFGSVTAVAMVLGLSMLIASVCSILLMLLVKGDIFGAPWLLRDGVLSLITALLMFSAAAITSERMTVILAMWSVCCGVGRLFGAFNQKKRKSKYWWVFALGALLSILLGVVYFYIPAPIDFVSNLFAGLFLIVQGLAIGFLWFEDQTGAAAAAQEPAEQ